MIKKLNYVFKIVIVLFLITSCTNAENKTKLLSMNLKIKDEYDKNMIIEDLNKFQLSNFDIKNINDSIFNITFSPDFDSLTINKLFDDEINLRFQIAHDMTYFMPDFYPLFNRIKFKNDNNPKTNSNATSLNGPVLGPISAEDTGTVNKFVRNFLKKNNTLDNIVYRWNSTCLRNDNLNLYFLENNSFIPNFNNRNLKNIKLIAKKHYFQKYSEERRKNNIPLDEEYSMLALKFDFNGIALRSLAEFLSFPSNKYMCFIVNDHIIINIKNPNRSGEKIKEFGLFLSSIDDLKVLYWQLLFNDYCDKVELLNFDLNIEDNIYNK